MPRLLILCEYPTLLGGERSMLSTLPAVVAAGFDVHVAAPPQGPLADALRASHVSHIPWETHDSQRERLPLEHLRSELGSLIRRNRPALVHANSLSTGRISGPVTVDCGVPSLGHLRDIIKLNPQAVADLNAHRRLVAVSAATRDFHVEQGIAGAKCVVVHNGVDLNEFRPRTSTGYLRAELGLPPSTRFVATIGQIGLRKATDVVLAAASLIADELPDVHWLIVGERSSNKAESRAFEAKLRSIAAEAPLVGRAHFLGSRSDVPRLMNECVLLVHAARQEPLGRVLLEAAASGMAIVATDVGGTREIFPIEADAALIVPPDNHKELTQSMLLLLADDELCVSLGTEARRRAEQAFDVRYAASRLVEQYQQLLQ